MDDLHALGPEVAHEPPAGREHAGAIQALQGKGHHRDPDRVVSLREWPCCIKTDDAKVESFSIETLGCPHRVQLCSSDLHGIQHEHDGDAFDERTRHASPGLLPNIDIAGIYVARLLATDAAAPAMRD